MKDWKPMNYLRLILGWKFQLAAVNLAINTGNPSTFLQFQISNQEITDNRWTIAKVFWGDRVAVVFVMRPMEQFYSFQSSDTVEQQWAELPHTWASPRHGAGCPHGLVLTQPRLPAAPPTPPKTHQHPTRFSDLGSLTPPLLRTG